MSLREMLYGFYSDRIVPLSDPFGDRFGKAPCPVPHGVIDNRDLVLLVIGCPFKVLVNNLQRVVAPDNPVARTDRRNGKVEPYDFIDLSRHKKRRGSGCWRGKADGLLEEFRLDHTVVKQVLAGDMLAKGIIGEENTVACKVLHHRIGPMGMGASMKTSSFVPRLNVVSVFTT